MQGLIQPNNIPVNAGSKVNLKPGLLQLSACHALLGCDHPGDRVSMPGYVHDYECREAEFGGYEVYMLRTPTGAPDLDVVAGVDLVGWIPGEAFIGTVLLDLSGKDGSRADLSWVIRKTSSLIQSANCDLVSGQ